MWTSNQYDGNSTGTRKRIIRTDPDLMFIGQYEATLVWGPETGKLRFEDEQAINLIHMGSNYWLSGTHLRGNDFLGSMEADL